MKSNRFFSGFFMLLAWMVLIACGGEAPDEESQLFLCTGCALVFALSLLIVGWLGLQNQNFSRSGG